MIRRIEIEAFKSIGKLTFEPGRVCVLIGENGCGKSNILEAIAFASAAAADRLSHEFMDARNIRMPAPRFMRPAFADRAPAEMRMTVAIDDDSPVDFNFSSHPDGVTSEWSANAFERHRLRRAVVPESAIQSIREMAAHNPEFIPPFYLSLFVTKQYHDFDRFLIYSPEYSSLRDFHRSGQILPIGVRGEGLFAHLRYLGASDHAACLNQISQRLQLIDWFDGFDLPADLAPEERRLSIRDRYLDPTAYIDQRSANEGFLFLLCYYTLLISPYTPRILAIDNIDASLNPRLCARLMRDLTELAKAGDKQVIVTTHNPAVLDGLDLTDDEQRLMVVSRTLDGPTRIRRVMPPQSIEGAPPIHLSEAFIRGYLGGLPDNF